MKTVLTHRQVYDRAYAVAAEILAMFPSRKRHFDQAIRLYPVPRGGIFAAYMVMAASSPGNFIIVESPEEADIIIDDLVDSGATRERYGSKNYFVSLYNKQREPHLGWVVFPWEVEAEGDIQDNVRRMLQFIGEDPARGGLQETPERVARAWKSWTSGYGQDPAAVLKVFEDGGESYDEMVLQRNLPFYSHCEHHMAPFFGTADIAYIPDGKIVGLSKLSRVLDIFARRLQVQERLTVQIVDCLMEHLQPKGAGVIIRARHLCMESRGVHKQGHDTVTSAVRGVFRTDASARAEFLSTVK